MKYLVHVLASVFCLLTLGGVALGSEVTIISTPVGVAQVNNLYEYDVEAVSNEPGDAIAFSLKKKPNGMVIDPATGLIQWMPHQTGVFEVEVRAQGNSSGSGSGHDDQRFWLTVLNGVPSSISGTVRSQAGDPISDVRLRLFEFSEGHFVFKTESNYQGEFMFPQVNPGTYVLRVNPRSNMFASQWFDRVGRIQDATPIVVAESAQVTLLVTLLPEDSANIDLRISGTVRDSAGAALAEVLVSFFRTREGGDLDPSGVNFRGIDDDDRHRDLVATVRTDSLGNYSAMLRSRTYVILAIKSGFEPQWWDHRSSLLEADKLSLARDTSGIDFDLRPRIHATGVIRGLITDPNGNSAAAHVLGLHRIDPHGDFSGFVRHGIADSTGLYQLDRLRSGFYVVLAIPQGDFLPTFYDTAGGTRRLSEAFPVPVSGGDVDGINITVQPDTISGLNRVRGIVTSAGFPVQGALLYAVSNASGEALSASLSGIDGSYELPGLMPGSYRVEAVKMNYRLGQSPPFTLAYAGLLPTTVTMNIALQEVTTDAQHEVALPRGFVLRQNFPNPFNPTTSIHFSIPVSGFVRIVVWDLLGREVEALVQSVLPAGLHTVEWDASMHSSGTYFYTMEVAGRTLSRRMILLK